MICHVILRYVISYHVIVSSQIAKRGSSKMPTHPPLYVSPCVILLGGLYLHAFQSSPSCERAQSLL